VSITGLLLCIKNPLEVSAGILLEVRFSEVLHPLILMQIDQVDFYTVEEAAKVLGRTPGRIR
jgi:hypothetical protein